MNILVAEDNLISAKMLQEILKSEGHDVTLAKDGVAAWNLLDGGKDPPAIAILDWMMPGMDGVQLCRKIRDDPRLRHIYIMMLSALDRKEEIATGLNAGANDYVTKPFNLVELKARISVGVRVASLEGELAARVTELEKALLEVKQLKQFLPICAYCKKVRNDDNYWQQIEHYISDHLDTQFSHGICPECFKKVVEPMLEQKEGSPGKQNHHGGKHDRF